MSKSFKSKKYSNIHQNLNLSDLTYKEIAEIICDTLTKEYWNKIVNLDLAKIIKAQQLGQINKTIGLENLIKNKIENSNELNSTLSNHFQNSMNLFNHIKNGLEKAQKGISEYGLSYLNYWVNFNIVQPYGE